MTGRDFIRYYGETSDRVTTVDPAETYFVRSAADHHVLENARVRAFVAALRRVADASAGTSAAPASAAANAGQTSAALTAHDRHRALIRAGRLMLASHASYGQRARMGTPETDLLVHLLMKHGPRRGIYGAKITGGGSGGTVAVFCADTPDAHAALAQAAQAYHQQTGITAQLLTGSSPGAAETPALKLTGIELSGGSR
jgi:L-arabinokinase